MENCIFCKIIKGEIPCYKIYESEKTLAFLDAHPLGKGHTLVIPKNHFENIHDIPEDDLKELILAVKETAKILRDKLNPTGMNLLQRNGRGAGQEVGHFHFHLVPRFKNDAVALPPISEYVEKDIENLHIRLTN